MLEDDIAFYRYSNEEIELFPRTKRKTFSYTPEWYMNRGSYLKKNNSNNSTRHLQIEYYNVKENLVCLLY